MTSDEFDGGIEKEIVRARSEYFTAIIFVKRDEKWSLMPEHFVDLPPY